MSECPSKPVNAEVAAQVNKTLSPRELSQVVIGKLVDTHIFAYTHLCIHSHVHLYVLLIWCVCVL